MLKSLTLIVGALGVVYGDIGTSPLYSVNEIFYGHGQIPLTTENIYGCIGLVIWALTIVISIKYIILVLRADNDGEGGVFALSSLIDQIKHKAGRPATIISALLIFASGLLLGDGMITPAISVVAAVEGLKSITPVFSLFVIPITILILTALFWLQKQGTAKVGSIFGPIIILWLISIGSIGFSHILHNPEIIINSINPIYVFNFISHISFYRLLLILGSVMLVVTGGEAMFADMGHFGRRPIRISWFSLVYPMLLLNYFGQGAYLLSGQKIINENIFYSMVPNPFLIPMVILATFAAVIASQAMISGAFSLTKQAIALGLFPRLNVIHTHHEHEGQLYIPIINWILYAGAISLVLFFQTSTRLASAYGLAVAGDMLVTTLGIFLIARYLWNWSLVKSVILLLPLLVIDIMFFASNSLKIIDGGYIPLGVALVVFITMKTWAWGRSKVRQAISKYPTMTLSRLIDIKAKSEKYIPRTIIIMTAKPVESVSENIPALEQMFMDRYGIISKNIIFMTVIQHKVPYMKHNRYEIIHFFQDKQKGEVLSVKLNFGFMEDPHVESQLEGLAKHHQVNISEHHEEWLIQILEDQIVPSSHLGWGKMTMVNFFSIMDRNSVSVEDYYDLGKRIRLSAEVLAVHVLK